MAWTAISKASNSTLSSTDVNNLQANFTAVAQGASGAPAINVNSLVSTGVSSLFYVVTSGFICTGQSSLSGNLFVNSIGFFGKISTGGELSPDVNYGGLCLNVGVPTLPVITIKGSGINHGMTDRAETDTAVTVYILDSNRGGLLIESFVETGVSYSFKMNGTVTDEDTTDTGSSEAAISLTGLTKSGTTNTVMSNTANIFTVRNYSTARLISKGNGDLHVTNTTLVALDDENDIELARNLQLALGGERYKHKVSKEGFKKLVDLKAISSTGEFQIVQGCTAVTLGAITQVWNVVKAIAKELGISEEKMLSLAKNYEMKELEYGT